MGSHLYKRAMTGVRSSTHMSLELIGLSDEVRKRGDHVVVVLRRIDKVEVTRKRPHLLVR